MSVPARRAGISWGELGRFLEIQNLGLNLAFAIAFLLLAAGGLPAAWTVFLIVVAFVAARNAGHSFNRWADRVQDARNPRTQARALVTGRASPGFALGLAMGNGAVLILAAWGLNPLALALAPVALALVWGYSYTKRFTTWTTAFLGLVEAITPAAIYIAVRGSLPPAVLWAVLGMLAWGTAFETIHSLGDRESDRALGLYSIPVRLGAERAAALVPVLHAAGLALLATFGYAVGMPWPYYVALGAMAIVAAFTDARVLARPAEARTPFQRHFGMSAIFLAGVALSLFALR